MTTPDFWFQCVIILTALFTFLTDPVEFSVQELQKIEFQKKALQHAREIVNQSIKSNGKRKLVLIIGNGVHGHKKHKKPLYGNEFLRRDRLEAIVKTQAKKVGETLSEATLKLYIWRYHERLRMESCRRMPCSALIYLFYMVKRKLVNTIITPNYELFLDTLLKKNNIPFVLNPVGNKPKAHDGYCSKNDQADVAIWKYHGDINHVMFRQCQCIFRLPEFSVYPFAQSEPGYSQIFSSLSLNGSGVSEEYSQLHHYHGNMHPSGWPDHLIDYNFPEISHDKLFKEEQEGIRSVFRESDSSSVAGFLIVGFAGRWVAGADRMSEEIVPDLINKVRAGIPAAMIFLPNKHKKTLQHSLLAQELFKINPHQLFIGDVAPSMHLIVSYFEELKPSLSLLRGWRASGLYL